MNQSFQDFILTVMQFSIGKIISKEKFEFRLTNTQNRISFLEPKSGFRLTSLNVLWQLKQRDVRGVFVNITKPY